jgi:hypothetical protein
VGPVTADTRARRGRSRSRVAVPCGVGRRSGSERGERWRKKGSNRREIDLMVKKWKLRLYSLELISTTYQPFLQCFSLTTNQRTIFFSLAFQRKRRKNLSKDILYIESAHRQGLVVGQSHIIVLS